MTCCAFTLTTLYLCAPACRGAEQKTASVPASPGLALLGKVTSLFSSITSVCGVFVLSPRAHTTAQKLRESTGCPLSTKQGLGWGTVARLRIRSALCTHGLPQYLAQSLTTTD